MRSDVIMLPVLVYLCRVLYTLTIFIYGTHLVGILGFAWCPHFLNQVDVIFHL